MTRVCLTCSKKKPEKEGTVQSVASLRNKDGRPVMLEQQYRKENPGVAIFICNACKKENNWE